MRIAVFLIAFLLLAAGGGGYWYYTTYMTEEAEMDVAAAAEEAEKKFEYVELMPVHIPMINREGLQQMVSLVIVLEVEDKAAADRIKGKEPRLVNAYLTHMYGNMNSRSIMRDGVLQVEAVRQRMEKITRYVLEDEDENIKDVLLQMVNQRRV